MGAVTIVHYCQHVLGVGHFFRSLEIVRALDRFRVVFVSGGESVPAALPPHARLELLPELMMDEAFNSLHAAPGRDVEAVKAERAERLYALFERERPDVFLVELYPFGRKSFGFELLPVLKAIREGRFGRVLVACSLRDILVEKSDREKYERRVLDALNSYFDLLLVHADPDFLRLDETFERAAEIKPPVVYTGFVTPRPAPGAGEALRRELGVEPEEAMIVASSGGGKVGLPLLEATLGACEVLCERRSVRLFLFTGPFLDEAEHHRLKQLAAARTGFSVERFTDCFLDYLAACDLSVSMAGYNTSMNILAAGAKALVWPFGQNREQRMRAEMLRDLGCLGVVEDEDLCAPVLAAKMATMLDDGVGPRACPLSLDGAERTARALEERLSSGEAS